MDKIIYYVFSSISFLQFYMSIIIEADKRGYKNFLIIRKDLVKLKNCPYSEENKKILNEYNNNNIFYILESKNINFNVISGIIFMIDGDIYGPAVNRVLKQSLLKKFENNIKLIKISLPEHINFIHTYHHYINNVDYCFFQNKEILNQKIELSDEEKKKCNFELCNNKKFVNFNKSKNFESDKNKFLGNTKFDNIPSKDEIYLKYKLNKNLKYCLIMFPKIRKNIDINKLLNIYSYLKRLNYVLLIKTRPKDDYNNSSELEYKFKGHYFFCSDIYPNQSLELLKICDLCIISSSSAIDECIYFKVPCIDLVSDLRTWGRNDYMKDNKIYNKILNWEDICFLEFKNIIKNLEKKDSNYFNILKDKYLFTHENSAKKYLDFIENEISIR